MSTVSFQFRMNFPRMSQKLRVEIPMIKLAIAAAMQFNRAMLFALSGAYNGHTAWAPLKLRQGQPLKDTGELVKSLSPDLNAKKSKPSKSKGSLVKLDDRLVSIGTNLHYAPMMNWGTSGLPGGKLVPVRAKALRIPLPEGGHMFRKSVVIPARRFDTWTEQDKREIQQVMKKKLLQVLSK